MSVCLSVCLSVTVLAGAVCTLRARPRYQKKALDVRNKINIAIWIKMFSSRVMTVFSSPRKLYLVLVPQNRHQRVTSTATRLLVREAWRLATPALPQTKWHKVTNTVTDELAGYSLVPRISIPDPEHAPDDLHVQCACNKFAKTEIETTRERTYLSLHG